MLFSILIANFNNAKFLPIAIESAIGQSYSTIEIIVVDDSSTDDSIDIIESYMKKDSRIFLYKNSQNMGCGFTKNRCIKLANGQICGFLDPDDKLHINAVKVMIEKHLEYSDCTMVFSNFILTDSLLRVRKKIKSYHTEGLLNISLIDNFVVSHFCTFKISAYNSTSGIEFTLKRAVDHDLYLKLEEVGSIVYVDKFLYYYRNHSNGISLFDNKYKALYWNLIVIQSACVRRGLDVEFYMSNELKRIHESHYFFTIFKPIDRFLKLLKYKFYKY